MSSLSPIGTKFKGRDMTRMIIGSLTLQFIKDRVSRKIPMAKSRSGVNVISKLCKRRKRAKAYKALVESPVTQFRIRNIESLQQQYAHIKQGLWYLTKSLFEQFVPMPNGQHGPSSTITSKLLNAIPIHRQKR